MAMYYSLMDNDSKNAILKSLLYANESSINLLQDVEPLSEEGTVEDFIFSVYFSKLVLKKANPQFFSEVKKDYDQSFISSLEVTSLKTNVPNLLSFVNDRFSFYMDELESMQNNENWLASRIYNIFYENTYSSSPSPSKNYPQMMKFHLVFLQMIGLIKENMETIGNHLSK